VLESREFREESAWLDAASEAAAAISRRARLPATVAAVVPSAVSSGDPTGTGSRQDSAGESRAESRSRSSRACLPIPGGFPVDSAYSDVRPTERGRSGDEEMPEPNTSFAGSIARNYDRYLVPLIFEQYAQDLARRTRVGAGGRVLETACGTGVVTHHLHGSLPEHAEIVATDLAAGMLEVARAKLGPAHRVQFRVADATALPFADGSFDAVVCQFGVMFFPDKDRGYREAARVLAPGGTFVFNVWDSLERNGFCGFVDETLGRMFPDDPPRFLSIPFGYHDLSEIREGLHAAGFDEIQLTVLPSESEAPSASDVASGLTRGTPLANWLEQRPDQAAVCEAVCEAIAAKFGEERVRAPMQSVAIVARKAATRVVGLGGGRRSAA
jgi:ubiquinone/menaquinone biosynthesis C-methylase UbiE